MLDSRWKPIEDTGVPTSKVQSEGQTYESNQILYFAQGIEELEVCAGALASNSGPGVQADRLGQSGGGQGGGDHT